MSKTISKVVSPVWLIIPSGNVMKYFLHRKLFTLCNLYAAEISGKVSMDIGVRVCVCVYMCVHAHVCACMLAYMCTSLKLFNI